MIIVGVAGRKRSGKDTIAAALVKELGFTRIAFADLLKDYAADIFELPRALFDSDDKDLVAVGSRTRLYAVRQYWISHGQESLSARELLQRVGGSARKIFGESFWIDRLRERLAARGFQRIVIPDVRHWSELLGLPGLAGEPGFAHSIRVNRADRTHKHEFAEFASGTVNRCAFVIDSDKGPTQCGLPRASHPSHWSGEVHASEVELPDSGAGCDPYDLVIDDETWLQNRSSAVAVAWVKARLPERESPK